MNKTTLRSGTSSLSVEEMALSNERFDFLEIRKRGQKESHMNFPIPYA